MLQRTSTRTGSGAAQRRRGRCRPSFLPPTTSSSRRSNSTAPHTSPPPPPRHAGTAPSSVWWRMRMWREGLRGSCMLLCFLFPRPTSPSAFRRTRNYPALRLFPTARSRNIAQKAHNELDAKDEGRPPDTPTPCQAETRNTDRVLAITEYERGRIAWT